MSYSGSGGLDYESVQLAVESDLHLNVYTAPAGTPTADGLAVLASWPASQYTVAIELPAPNGQSNLVVRPSIATAYAIAH